MGRFDNLRGRIHMPHADIHMPEHRDVKNKKRVRIAIYVIVFTVFGLLGVLWTSTDSLTDSGFGLIVLVGLAAAVIAKLVQFLKSHIMIGFTILVVSMVMILVFLI